MSVSSFDYNMPYDVEYMNTGCDSFVDHSKWKTLKGISVMVV